MKKNDEIFLKRWTRIREKGKFSYIILSSIIPCLLVSIIIYIYDSFFRNTILNKQYISNKFFKNIVLAIIIGSIIGFISWKRTEKKYTILICKEKIKSDKK